MNLRKPFGAGLCILVSMGIVVQLIGCGTLIYPERRGQKSGPIDPGIAILDGIGLLVFIIPGLVAFAVDFTTGAIYLPGGAKKSSALTGQMKVTRVNLSELNKTTIREIVMKETGCPASVDMSKAEVYVLKKSENIETVLVELHKTGYGKNNSMKKSNSLALIVQSGWT
jgi:hypothetical protein